MGRDGHSGNTMWGGRFSEKPDEIMEAFNASISFDRRLARQDIQGSLAHARMLGATGILSPNDTTEIERGLAAILAEIESGAFDYKTSLEDIHLNIEARLITLIGDVGARLHTGRSRNDQVATDMRLWTRDKVGTLITTIRALQKALVKKAQTHEAVAMPGFTHLQTAQPILFAHYCLAYVEMLDRDAARFADAAARLNECPLGAAALAGTPYPIDRAMTAKALGFTQPMRNSIDAVSARDFLQEVLAAATICATHLSRLAEELVLFSSAQFGFIRMPDQFSTGSSIMPQKRNPDAAELTRGKAGRIVGAFTALTVMLKGLPLAYSKDMQEDKEQVFDALDQLEACLRIMVPSFAHMNLNEDAMTRAAAAPFITATDLADWLVREKGIPFRTAHHVTGALVAKAEAQGKDLPDLSLAEMQAVEPLITQDVFEALSVEASIAARQSVGGTAPNRVAEQIAFWNARL